MSGGRIFLALTCAAVDPQLGWAIKAVYTETILGYMRKRTNILVTFWTVVFLIMAAGIWNLKREDRVAKARGSGAGRTQGADGDRADAEDDAALPKAYPVGDPRRPSQLQVMEDIDDFLESHGVDAVDERGAEEASGPAADRRRRKDKHRDPEPSDAPRGDPNVARRRL